MRVAAIVCSRGDGYGEQARACDLPHAGAGASRSCGQSCATTTKEESTMELIRILSEVLPPKKGRSCRELRLRFCSFFLRKNTSRRRR
ncbi:hypothetical protein [Brevibacillus sp. H7]|uniref:hypothetical protein n=1 Tax=Brevibacillus sp. H7 TaxID=3349138 RepID=UPI00382D5C7C